MRKTYFFAFSITTILFFISAIAVARNDQNRAKMLLSQFKYSSMPTKVFNTPTGKVLKSLEVLASFGSSFGIEESTGILGRASIGLGGVAEVELTRSSFMNRLTGEQSNFSTSIFKMILFLNLPLIFSKM